MRCKSREICGKRGRMVLHCNGVLGHNGGGFRKVYDIMERLPLHGLDHWHCAFERLSEGITIDCVIHSTRISHWRELVSGA